MTAQPDAVQMATYLTLGSAALDWVSRDPARWDAFTGWACAAAEAPPIADREQAQTGFPVLANLARGILRAARLVP